MIIKQTFNTESSILRFKGELPTLIRGNFNHSVLSKSEEKRHSIGDGWRFVIIYHIGSKWIRVIDPYYLLCGNYTLDSFSKVLSTFTYEEPIQWSVILKTLKYKINFYENWNREAANYSQVIKDLEEGRSVTGKLNLNAPGFGSSNRPIGQAIYYCVSEIEKKLTL